MAHKSLIEKKSQAGFTLVELAIVMIIIGLLIGGVLKGQELIGNAQITATTSQIESYDAATTTFKDIYDAMPGDIANAAVRLPNCTAKCNNSGDGNGRVGVSGSVYAAQAGNSENEVFWTHLAAADLITGINPNQANGWGGLYPETEIGGSGYYVGYDNSGSLGTSTTSFPGHYLLITAATPGGAPSNDSVTANQAARIDRKLDDGVPAAGSIFDAGGGCTTGTDYNEASTAALCDLLIRFQG